MQLSFGCKIQTWMEMIQELTKKNHSHDHSSLIGPWKDLELGSDVVQMLLSFPVPSECPLMM